MRKFIQYVAVPVFLLVACMYLIAVVVHFYNMIF